MEASVGVGKPMQGTLLITHPVVQGKLTYLESGASFDGTLPLGGGAPRIPPVTEVGNLLGESTLSSGLLQNCGGSRI